MIKRHATIIFDDDEIVSNKSKGFSKDTSIRISQQTTNELAALTNLGYAKDKKSAIDFLIESFKSKLDTDSKKELDLQVKTLERRDAKLKG